MTPKPFVKWNGGKGQLLAELLPRVPPNFNRYHEPFVGGGALFFALQPHRAALADINTRLINTYRWIKTGPQQVIDFLEGMKAQHCAEFYYSERSKLNLNSGETAEDAARFIYLNKTGYNGLYRENSKSDFNVPVGRYKKPSIYDRDTIFAASKALRKATLKVQGFSKSRPDRGDFVYFDPPYDPVNDASFTSYNKSGFTRNDQAELAQRVRDLADRGVYCMVSNSDTQFIRDLYADFPLWEVLTRRSSNSKGGDRGAVKELIICTYQQ